MQVVDSSIAEMIREITAPEGGGNEAARETARGRPLAAAEPDRATAWSFLRQGRRGLALIAALLVVPTGVAVAAGLGPDGDRFVAVEDCPELQAAVEARGVSTEGLVLADCPVGTEVQETLHLLTALERRRTELELDGGRQVAILGIGRS
jgi:hypothetical protein